MSVEQRFENRISRRDKKRKPKMKMHGRSIFEIKKLKNKKHDNKRILKRN